MAKTRSAPAPEPPAAPQAPKPLATPDEVAAYLRKPVRTLTQWRYLGIGPAYHRTGRDVRYDWADVLAWHGQQRHETSDG